MKATLHVTLGSLVALALAGCNTSAPPADPGTATSGDSHAGHDDEAHAHDHGAGPHDGTIGEFGGGKHIEFIADHAKQEATVYILGGDAKSPAPIKADKLVLTLEGEPAVQVDLAAKPLEGEAEGESSRFVGTHEALGKEQEFAGTVTAEVEGTPYEGEFKQEAHSHEQK
jgi:hypothetical protein